MLALSLVGRYEKGLNNLCERVDFVLVILGFFFLLRARWTAIVGFLEKCVILNFCR